MNIYVSKEYANVFLENLKEIPIIDDYNLDRERLGKEKVIINSKAQNIDVLTELISIMPIDSMIVDQVEYPGKQYILCVGEVNPINFQKLVEIGVEFSILTMKSDHLRFNAWVDLNKLQQIYTSEFVNNLSSINGMIEENTFFVIESADGKVNEIHNIISEYSNEFIIKNDDIYVKLFMKDFSSIYSRIESLFKKIDIIDANSN